MAGRFAEALVGFREAAVLRPGDVAAIVLAARAEGLIREPVSEDWDGLFAQTTKL